MVILLLALFYFQLHYAGIITDEVREEVSKFYTDMHGLEKIDENELEKYFLTVKLRQYLFPSRRLLLDYVPYDIIKQNIPLLKGRNVEFFSDVKLNGNDVTGLLTAGSSYKCNNPPQSYTIDVFGSDENNLEKHVAFHIKRAIKLSQEPICLQIFITKGHIAEELCRVLRKYTVAKCNWYVEGGLTIKTIVEEDLWP